MGEVTRGSNSCVVLGAEEQAVVRRPLGKIPQTIPIGDKSTSSYRVFPWVELFGFMHSVVHVSRVVGASERRMTRCVRETCGYCCASPSNAV